MKSDTPSRPIKKSINRRDDAVSPAQIDPTLPLFGHWRETAVAALAFFVATLLVFGDLLFGGGEQVLSSPGDLSGTFVGWAQFCFGEMAKGNLPLWNPHLYSGAPCLGGFQEALLYPPSWLHLLLPMAPAFNVGIALHVFLAGFFTYLWMVRRGLEPIASILAGLVFMFGGGYFMHITQGHLPNLRTMVWAPLIFLAIDDLTVTRSLRGAWLGAGAAAMAILAGHVQYVYYLALICIPYALLGLWSAVSRPRAILGLALIALGAGALSAVQLLTGLQAAQESARSALPYEIARSFPFPPENLLTAIFPDLFGSSAENSYWGRWFLWEDSLYIGAGAFALALYGAIAGRRKYRRFAVTMLVISLLFALGYYTPLYVPLYRHLPGFGSFRGVSKFAFLAALFLANLVAVGFHRLMHVSKITLLPIKLIAGFAIACTLLAAAIWFSGKQGMQGVWGHFFAHVNWKDEARAYGPFQGQNLWDGTAFRAARDMASSLLVAAVFSAVVAGCWFGAIRQRRWVYGIAAIIVFELLLFCWQNRPTFDLQQMEGEAAQYHKMVERVAQMGPDLRALSGNPTIYMMAGGNDGWGNDPMVLRRYADFIAYGQGVSGDELLRRNYPFFREPGPLWGLVRIRAFLFPGREGRMMLFPYQGRHLRESQFVETAEVVDPQRMLPMLADPNFNVFKTALVEAPVAALSGGLVAGAGPAGTAELTDRNTDLIEITADVKRPSILLMSDNYSTGWRARALDAGSSQKYQVIRADYTLRAIPLTPGHHHIALEYLPVGFVVGKWISLSALIVYFLTAILYWKPWKRSAPPEPKAHSRI